MLPTLIFAARQTAVERIVDRSGFLQKPLRTIEREYEKSRPRIVRVQPAMESGEKISSQLTQITLHFSEPMDTTARGFDYGPLGEENVLGVQKVIGFSADRRAFTFEVALRPNRRYQSLVTNNFRNPQGIRLKPFLLDLTTTE